MDTELEEGRARLRHLQKDSNNSSKLWRRIGNLETKLAAIEEEKDSLRSTTWKRQTTAPNRADDWKRVPVMPKLVPTELEEWMSDRQSELQNAITLGDYTTILEYTSMLSHAAVRMMDMSSRIFHWFEEIKSKANRYGLRGCRVGEASHPWSKEWKKKTFDTAQITKSEPLNGKHNVRTESLNNLIQGASIPSDRGTDSKVWPIMSSISQNWIHQMTNRWSDRKVVPR